MPLNVFDLWYADDGQEFLRLCQVDGFLRALDGELAPVGCTRGELPAVKSSVTLIGHPAALAAVDDAWVTELVGRTCKVLAPNSAIEVLGTMVGPDSAVRQQFHERVAGTNDLHKALGQLCDPAAELTLGRSCADVARVNHLLRTSGDILAGDAATLHDYQQRCFVDRALGGDLGEAALDQASLGIRAGGLGFRPATDSALAAFVASRVESAPLVHRIFAGMDALGLPGSAARRLFDSQLAAAQDKLALPLPRVEADSLVASCREASEIAHRRLAAMLAGSEVPHSDDDSEDAPRSGVVDEAGSEDPEHTRSRGVPRLQRQLAALFDRLRAATLRNSAAFDDHDRRRIDDLRDRTVSHDWLWSLAPSSRRTVESDAYVDAVRLRLGACEGPSACKCCGRRVQVNGRHAHNCASGPATVGHSDARDRLLELARLGDPRAEKEAKNLIPAAPALRPADVLTSAAGDRLMALDVGIASPDSLRAIRSGDAVESMRTRKLDVYRAHLGSMDAAGITYQPMPWSCWGREHPETSVELERLSKRAARRRGHASWRTVLSVFRADLGAILARRSSSMWRVCAYGRAHQE